MTTQITILNRGNKAVEVTGGSSGTPVTIQPHSHADVWLYDAASVAVVEVAPIAPNLAGGPGEEHP